MLQYTTNMMKRRNNIPLALG